MVALSLATMPIMAKPMQLSNDSKGASHLQNAYLTMASCTIIYKPCVFSAFFIASGQISFTIYPTSETVGGSYFTGSSFYVKYFSNYTHRSILSYFYGVLNRLRQQIKLRNTSWAPIFTLYDPPGLVILSPLVNNFTLFAI